MALEQIADTVFIRMIESDENLGVAVRFKHKTKPNQTKTQQNKFRHFTW